MGGKGGTKEEIEERLAGLEVAYDSFAVHQTTISLPAPQFERISAASTSRRAEAYVKVYNEDGQILQYTGGKGETLPRVDVGYEQRLEHEVQAAVERQTGIESTIDGLERATIAGIRNIEDSTAETRYCLILVFTATRRGGTAGPDAEWLSQLEQSRVAYVF